jgi:hypothetical protein
LVSELCNDLDDYSLASKSSSISSSGGGGGGQFQYGLIPSSFTPIIHYHIPKTGGTNFNLQLVHIAYYIERHILKEFSLHHNNHNNLGHGKNKLLNGEQHVEIVAGEYCELSTTSAHHVLPYQFLHTFGSSGGGSGPSILTTIFTKLWPFGSSSSSSSSISSSSSSGTTNLRTTTRASRMASPSSSFSLYPTEADTPAVQTQKLLKAEAAAKSSSWIQNMLYPNFMSAFVGFVRKITFMSNSNNDQGCSILSGEMDASILSDMKKEISNRQGYEFVIGNHVRPEDKVNINLRMSRKRKPTSSSSSSSPLKSRRVTSEVFPHDNRDDDNALHVGNKRMQQNRSHIMSGNDGDMMNIRRRRLLKARRKGAAVIVQPITMLREPIARTISQVIFLVICIYSLSICSRLISILIFIFNI